MDFVSHRLFRRSFGRRFVSAILAAMYIATAAGVPLPAGDIAVKIGESFPCSDHACGCTSAEQCWRSCCCHSLAERIEWAREHKVRPPEFAIAEARRASIDVAWLQDPAAPGFAGCSIGGHLTSCAGEEKKRPAKPGAAGWVAMQCVRRCCAKHHEAKPNGQASSRIIGWKALNCQGHSANWLSALPTLVSIDRGQSDELPIVEWMGPAISDAPGRIAFELLLPPPERT